MSIACYDRLQEERRRNHFGTRRNHKDGKAFVALYLKFVVRTDWIVAQEQRMNRLSRVANRLVTGHIKMRFSPRCQLNHRNRGKINFIDVGSVGGLPDPWRANANLVWFVLNFEPNVPASRQANSLTYNTAVWETDAVLPFYIYKGFDNTGSSLFKQNLEYVFSCGSNHPIRSLRREGAGDGRKSLVTPLD